MKNILIFLLFNFFCKMNYSMHLNAFFLEFGTGYYKNFELMHEKMKYCDRITVGYQFGKNLVSIYRHSRRGEFTFPSGNANNKKLGLNSLYWYSTLGLKAERIYKLSNKINLIGSFLIGVNSTTYQIPWYNSSKYMFINNTGDTGYIYSFSEVNKQITNNHLSLEMQLKLPLYLSSKFTFSFFLHHQFAKDIYTNIGKGTGIGAELKYSFIKRKV